MVPLPLGSVALTCTVCAQAITYHNLQVMFQHIHLLKGGGTGTGGAPTASTPAQLPAAVIHLSTNRISFPWTFGGSAYSVWNRLLLLHAHHLGTC